VQKFRKQGQEHTQTHTEREMSGSKAAGSMVVVEETEKEEPEVVQIVLKRKNKKVEWTEDTVDNEHLNKKSSKSE